MPLTFGRVLHPPFVNRDIPSAQTTAWDDLGPRRPLGVCWHSMVGTLWGTDAYFRGGPALTDYGIGGATDGSRWDGVILRWNDPRGRRSPWANGGSDGLEGDGPLFVRTLGVDAINRDLVSIERSDGGEVSTPLSPKQAASLCLLTAYWFDQAHVPWDRFPLNPAHGVVTHMLHLEFATKGCPFAPVVERVAELQDRVRALLKTAQTGEPGKAPVRPPKPVRPDHDWWPQGYDLAPRRPRGSRSRSCGACAGRSRRTPPTRATSSTSAAPATSSTAAAPPIPAAQPSSATPRSEGKGSRRKGKGTEAEMEVRAAGSRAV
jgi:hypothetical protein